MPDIVMTSLSMEVVQTIELPDPIAGVASANAEWYYSEA